MNTDTNTHTTKVRDLKAGMKIRCADLDYRTISEDSVVDSLATASAWAVVGGIPSSKDATRRLLMTDGTWTTVTVSGQVFTLEVK